MKAKVKRTCVMFRLDRFAIYNSQPIIPFLYSGREIRGAASIGLRAVADCRNVGYV